MEWLTAHPEVEELNKESKAHILQIATRDVQIEKEYPPLDSRRKEHSFFSVQMLYG